MVLLDESGEELFDSDKVGKCVDLVAAESAIQVNVDDGVS